jgi:hypothetical protein
MVSSISARSRAPVGASRLRGEQLKFPHGRRHRVGTTCRRSNENRALGPFRPLKPRQLLFHFADVRLQLGVRVLPQLDELRVL